MHGATENERATRHCFSRLSLPLTPPDISPTLSKAYGVNLGHTSIVYRRPCAHHRIWRLTAERTGVFQPFPYPRVTQSHSCVRLTSRSKFSWLSCLLRPPQYCLLSFLASADGLTHDDCAAQRRPRRSNRQPIQEPRPSLNFSLWHLEATADCHSTVYLNQNLITQIA